MPMTTASGLRVRVGLPHFFRESESSRGYGSSRRGSRLPRGLALHRCLEGLLNLARQPQDLMLDIRRNGLRPLAPLGPSPPELPPLELDIHVFTDGQHRLEEVLDLFRGRIQVHSIALEDPRQLPLVCRDQLIQMDPCPDLCLYSEDDLVIHDPLFFDKQSWFLRAGQSRAVLMPHRYELIPGQGGRRLLPDGPLTQEVIEAFYKPLEGAAGGNFLNRQVVFDRPPNPHSGMFCIDAAQVQQLRRSNLPTRGFFSPLETAATYTVMQHFPVLKPALAQRDFHWVEHAHPSFLIDLNQWPICPA